MTIIGDLHTHTLASTHAYSTVYELLLAASRKQHKLLAVTDHGPAIPDAPHEWHFNGLSRFPAEIGGVRLLSGCEANIMPGGALDMPDPLLHRLDFVIASMHAQVYPETTAEANTEAWLRVAANPEVDCLGHAGQAAYPFDIPAVVAACKRSGAIFEINSASFSIRRGSDRFCREIALECMRQEVSVVVTSDAHCMYEVGEFSDSLALLASIGFPEELVLNSSVRRFSDFYRQRNHTELFREDERDSAYWD